MGPPPTSWSTTQPGRLISFGIDLPDPTPDPAPIATFTYDGDGQRVKAVVNGVTTYYIGNYYEVTETTSGTTTRQYYYAGAQRLAVRETRTGYNYVSYFLPDHLGSNTITASPAGTSYAVLGYSAWGEEAFAIVTAPTPTTFGYTGQRREESLGLYFYGARWYDPFTSHFLSADTLVPDPYQPVDWNRFGYARYNPVRYTDPTGHAVADDDRNGCGSDKCNSNPPTPSPAPSPTNSPFPSPTSASEFWWKPFPTDTSTPPTILLPGSTRTPTPTVPPSVIKRPDGTYIWVDWGRLVDWSKVDKIDLGIDILGLVGQFAPAAHVEVGGAIYFVSEIGEVIGVAKDIYDMTQGDPSGVSRSVALRTIDLIVDIGKVHPAVGYIFNMIGLGITVGPAVNVDAIHIVAP